MKKIIKIILILCIVSVLCVFGFQSCSGKNHVHYRNDDYCFVYVRVGTDGYDKAYSGTMSVTDYQRWVNGDSGTVFVYTDNKAKYGVRLNIARIINISNYGDTPSAYD